MSDEIKRQWIINVLILHTKNQWKLLFDNTIILFTNYDFFFKSIIYEYFLVNNSYFTIL